MATAALKLQRTSRAKPSRPRPSVSATAMAEATSFVTLLKHGNETAESIRKLISEDTPGRRRVLDAFDSLVARLGKNGKLLHNMKHSAVSERLRSQVLCRLRKGVTQAEIEKAVPVSQGVIQELSIEIRASLAKTGRGRRLSPEIKQTITDRLKAGAKSIELEREFAVCSHTIRKMRRALNDGEDRRHRRKLTPAQIEEATSQLRAGRTWRAVAWDFGVNEKTLSVCVPFRKNSCPSETKRGEPL